MKHMKRLCALFLSLVLTLSLVTPAIPAAQAAGSGTTYYVSTLNGSDSNNGTSAATAFYSLSKINALTLGAGDKVLLERGSVFENQYLHIKGSGAEGNPIVIDAYGTGEKPLINTNGQGVWYQNYGVSLDNSNHVWRGYVSSCVLLFDVEYIEVNNLAMTNWGGVDDGATVTGESGYSASAAVGSYTWGGKMNRTGVAVVTQDIGTAEHIYLKNLEIENIFGNVYDKHMNNGGIYFTVAKPHNEAETGIARYDDVLIEGNYLKRTSRWGIAAAYTAYWGKFTNTAISDEVCQKYGTTGLVIRGNYLEEVGGDPITTMYAFEPLIEYNVSHKGAREITSYYHNSSRGNKGTVAAGIWPWKCKTALFQYNECYDLTGPKVGNGDGQAWDADSGDSTIYQYNYSAGNAGGCVMLCLQQAYNTVFRYNISYKDGEGSGVLNTCSAPNGKYYNNTFIIAETAKILRDGMMGGNHRLENNIFYGLGTARAGNWNENTPNAVYDNNLYYNFTNKPASDAAAIQVAAGTDIFVAAPVGPTAPSTTAKGAGKANVGWTHDWAVDFENFKLKSGSPAINAGRDINLSTGIGSDHGASPVTKDFYGTALDASHDIGAHDTATPDLKLTSAVYTVDQAGKTIAKVPNGLTVADFMKNITTDAGVTAQVKKNNVALDSAAIVDMDCVVVLSHNGATETYTITKDSDKALKTCVFELEKNKNTGELVGDRQYQINVPFGGDFPLSLSDFLAGITVAPTATAKVYNGPAEVTSGNLADGMILRITAQDESVQEYVIKQKNVYNHSTDFVKKPVQGNVWYAQTKVDNAYTDMTQWDGTWTCWSGTGYASVEHYSICGNINANSDTASTSMAFRAPVNGTVNISFDTSSWPVKFRNSAAANNGGTVTLLITKNGQLLPEQSYELPKNSSPVNVEPCNVTVRKGDMIRLEAQCVGSISLGGFSMVPVVTYRQPEVDTQAPSVPEGLYGEIGLNNSVTVHWTPSTDNVGVTSYLVSLDNAEAITVTECSNTYQNVAAGAHTVSVKAVDAAGNMSDAATHSFTVPETADTTAPTQPGKPVVKDAASLTMNTIGITWAASTDGVGVSRYEVLVDGVKHGDTTTNSYTITGLNPKTTYAVTVVAKDAAGNTSVASEAENITTVAKKIKIACVGDSITQGNQYNIRTGYDYPSRLGDLLGDQYEVKNFGHSGATMVAVWGEPKFIDRWESRACIEYNPDVVIIMLGSNDGHPDAWNGANAKNTFAGLAKDMIDAYRACPSNPEIIFATSPTATKGTYYGQDVDVINNDLAAVQRKVAKDNNCKLIDMNALTREFFASGLMTRYAPVNGVTRDDRLHPNEDGYYEIAKLMKQGVDELLGTVDSKNYVLTDDRSGAITYTGAWTNTDGDPTLYNETSKITHTAGDTASFTFNGTSIQVVGEIYGVRSGENFGYADVTIDGNPAGMATFLYNKDDPELTRTNRLKKEVVFEKTGLTAGTHTITLTARALKAGAPGAGRCGVSLDGFFVGGAIDTGALKRGLTDAKLAYAGAVKAGDNSPAAGALLAAINLATKQVDVVATQAEADAQADAINAAVAAYAQSKTANYTITVTPPARGSATLTLADGAAATMPVAAGTKLKLTVTAGKGSQVRSILFGDTKLTPQPKRDGSITIDFTAACNMTVAPTVDSRTIRVACIGDSITHGACSSSPQINGYPAQLQALLGDGYTVGNFAMSSACARDDGNFPYEAQSVSIQSKNFLPDVVVIMLGTNDASPNNWTGYGAAGFKADVKALVETYRALPSAPEVFLATAPFSRNAGIETPIHNEVAPATRTSAAELGCTLIDMHTATENLDSKYFNGDGVHFNNAGYTLMANLMNAGLKGEIDKSALETLYNRCKDIAQFQCDASGWAAFDDARTAAKAVLDNEAATGVAIEIARLALADAEKALTVIAPTKVICVGDSITYGAVANPRETWNYPTQLQGMLGKGYVVENYGVNGRTVNDRKSDSYTTTAQFTASKNSKPDIVILMMGTNDSKDKNWESVERFKESATSLINVYKNLPTRPLVYLATSPAVFSDESTYPGEPADNVIKNSRIKGLIAPAQRELATELGCTLIDVNEKTNAMADAGTLATDFLSSDKIHPHNAGYTILAGYMFEGLIQSGAGTRPKVVPTVFELEGLNLLVPVAARITVAQLKADLAVGDGVVLTITTANGATVADTAAVAAGMKVVATAGVQHTDYTVVARNEYHHYNEFVGNKQGPIWFYERKLKSDNTYQNFTFWNNGGWWGGQGPDWSAAERKGAGNDVRGEASRVYASTSMGYQAPADGTVSISFDGKPTFEVANSNQNVGTVHLVITKNGSTIQGQDYQIPAYGTGLTVTPFTVALQKGDRLRFEIANRGGAITGGGILMRPIVTYVQSDAEAPTAPAALVVAGVTKTSANLTWTASTDNIGVTKYVVTYGPTGGTAATKEVTTTNCALTGLTEGTKYTVKVTAYDAAGNSTDSAPITFHTESGDVTAPTAPGNVAVAPADEGGVVTWTASGDAVGVTGYKIYLDEGEQPIHTTDGATLTYTLTGLNPWTNHTVKVSAVDAAGNESGKTAKTFKTTDSVAPSAPNGVQAGTVTKNSAVITWTAATDNVAVTGYEISNGTNTYSISGGTTTTYTISGLTAGRTYTVSVVAMDAAGNKSMAGTVEVTTEASEDTTPPAIPQNVSVSGVSATGATVTWDAVTDDDLDGYTVYWTDGTISKSATVADTESYAITGLSDLTNYTVTVDAYDTSGNHSGKSESAEFTTSAGSDTEAPTKPAGLAVSVKTTTTATITWNASTDNVAVAKYTVTYGPVGGESATVDVTEGTTCMLNSLTAGTEYSVVVSAHDAAGNHSESEALVFATEELPSVPDTEVPGVPGGLTVSDVTTTGAVLSWTAATDNVGVVKYLVYNGETLVDEMTATTYTVAGLTAGTSYTFKVVAVDASDNQSDPAQVSFATKSEGSGPPPSTGGTGGSISSSTEKNEDGSTTTTVTDKRTGTVTETTKWPDGSKTVVVTKKDGTVTSNGTRKDGVTVETLTTPGKETTASVVIPERVGKTIVRVPAPALTPGTVAVIVKEDGTEEIIRRSVALNGNMVFPLEKSARIKLVDNSKAFSDVAENSYYRSAVDFVTARELFQGVGEGKFAPELTLDRGMLVTVLYRLSDGQDLTAAVDQSKTAFSDVADGAWYAEAVDWAVKNGVTTGTGTGFAPQAKLSREQMAVFLYNYAGKPKAEETYRFADSEKISTWAEQAISWAVANGILMVGDDSRVNPQDNASRGDTAMMLQQFVQYLAR